MKIRKLATYQAILYLAFIALVFAPVKPAAAQDSQSSLLFGQVHRYSVIFRGNGEAIVYARIVLTNPSSTSALNQLKLEASNGRLSEFTAFQQVFPPRCLKYNYNGGSNDCVQFGDPDYNPTYYGYDYSYGGTGAQTQYYPLKIDQSGNDYQLTLSQPLAPTKSGAVILSYIATGYVKKSFLGLYSFNFETLKATERISDMQVSADVDSELYLKGKRSQVNYNMPSSASLGLNASESARSSPALDTLSSQIGADGPIVKTAKGLAPGETLTVKGEYAASWWRLYLSSIIWFILIVAAIIGGTWWLTRFLKRRRMKMQNAAPASVPAPAAAPAMPSHSILLPTMATGLVVAAVIIGLNYLVGSLGGILDNTYGYMGGMTAAIMYIVIILLYALILVGPAVWFGFKRGWKAVILVIVFEIVWLVILGLLIFLLFQTGTSSYPDYYRTNVMY